jgi:hypothetical protein
MQTHHHKVYGPITDTAISVYGRWMGLCIVSSTHEIVDDKGCCFKCQLKILDGKVLRGQNEDSSFSLSGHIGPPDCVE